MSTRAFPCSSPRRQGLALALACSTPWRAMSVGFVGASDGWQDLSRNKRLTRRYRRAEEGNVALTGEVDLERSGGTFVLALGLGRNPAEAAFRAIASLTEDFDGAPGSVCPRVVRLAARRSRRPPSPSRGRPVATSTGSAWRSCGPTRPRPSRAGLSPASRSPGASPGETTTWAATTWSGRATWSRPPGDSWPPGAWPTRTASWSTSRSPRRPTATGRRTCGSPATPTGTASSSTRPRCRSCW